MASKADTYWIIHCVYKHEGGGTTHTNAVWRGSVAKWLLANNSACIDSVLAGAFPITKAEYTKLKKALI